MATRIVDKVELGRRLRERRKRLDRPQKVVAAAAEMPVSTLCDWEAGAMPTALLDLAKLASALECTPDDLLLERESLGRARERAAQLPEAAADAVNRVVDDLVQLYHLSNGNKNVILSCSQHLRTVNDLLVSVAKSRKPHN